MVPLRRPIVSPALAVLATACSALVPLPDGGPTASDAGASLDGGAGGGAGADAGSAGGSLAGVFATGPAGCEAIGVEVGANVDGYRSDLFSWSDAECGRRSAALVQNDRVDPGGSRGGFLRALTYDVGGSTRTVTGTGAQGWHGWGYVVNHYVNAAGEQDADLSRSRTGTFRTLLSGPHHAVHEFKLRMMPGGPVDVTVHWTFATGRSEPVYAVTYDATPAGADVVRADTRAPYGDLAFEGIAGPIGGIGWGDSHRFTTTGNGPVTPQSPWDYTQPNRVPYVRMWSSAVDAEMGAVATQTFEEQVRGGDYGNGQLAANCHGKTSANHGPDCVDPGEVMPIAWLWPFQLNQWELPYSDSSHRMAWGSNFGAVGQRTFTAFGRTQVGYPIYRDAVLLVLDLRSKDATLGAVTAVERLRSARVAGAIWNPAHAAWDVACAGFPCTVQLDPLGGPVRAPVFRFSGFSATGASEVRANGVALALGAAALASVDVGAQVLWVTLNGTVTGALSLAVR